MRARLRYARLSVASGPKASGRMPPSRRPPSSIRRDTSGFALLAVLGVTLVLALIAVAAARTSRSTLTIASGVRAQAQAHAAAEGGIWWAARLLQQDPAAMEPATRHATPQELVGSEVDVSVRWTLERTKIDLNRASGAAIAETAEAAGLEGAEALGAAVLERRARFAAAGIPWRVDALPIESIHEVFDLVPLDDRSSLVQHFTVHGGRVATASGDADGGSTPQDILLPGDVIAVEAQATHVAGAQSAVVALLRLDPSGAIEVLTWRDAAAP